MRWTVHGRARKGRLVLEPLPNRHRLRTTILIGTTVVPYNERCCEKRKPTYDLEAFKEAYSAVGKLVATGAALRGARDMGFGPQEMVNAIQALTFKMFYKSMTSYADHRIWQDVYHVPYEGYEIYLKFTADTVTDFVVLSFKEKGDG